jgi:hypothetical protein
MRSDYDAFLDELTPITIHVLGKDWQVPRSPRADEMAKLQRAQVAAARVAVKAQQLQQAAKTGTAKQKEKANKDAMALLSETPTEYADTVAVARVLAGDEVADAWLAGGIRDAALKAIVADLWAEQQPKASRLGEAVDPDNGQASSSSNGHSSKRTSVESTG